MVTQTELINYFSSIDKALHSFTNEKRHIIKALRSDVEEYLIEFPEASLENLMSRFGTPDSIAMEYVQGMPVDEIGARINSGRFNKKAVLIALAVIVASVLVFLIAMTLITWDNSTQHYTRDIVAVIDQLIIRRV